jgi:hypothetical protein
VTMGSEQVTARSCTNPGAALKGALSQARAITTLRTLSIRTVPSDLVAGSMALARAWAVTSAPTRSDCYACRS